MGPNTAGARAARNRRSMATNYIDGENARDAAKNAAQRAEGMKHKTHRKARIPDETILAEMKKYKMTYGGSSGKLYRPLTKLHHTDLDAQKGYEKYYSMMWRFFKKIGRTKSSIILCDNLKKGIPIPSMDPSDVLLFMLNKRGTKGEVVDAHGVSFVCDGGWKKIGCESLFRSALSYCHTARGHVVDQWNETCDLCIRGHNGGEDCGYHNDNNRWYENGNVIFSEEFKDQMKVALDATSELGITKANSLTNEEMYQYGIYLCSGEIEKFMLYVIMIVGGSCYCRESGVNSLKVESIMTDISHDWVGPGTQMEYLTLDIRGKNRKQLLMMWRNDSLFLDPIYVLFWWLNVTGIRSGFLFPNPKKLKDSGIDNSQAISSEAFSKLYRVHFRSFFPETEFPDKPDVQSTPHGIRRGRFLEAAMGGATDYQMQEDSGLKHSKTLAAYLAAVRSFVDRLKVEYPQTWNNHVMPYKSQNLRYEDHVNRMVMSDTKLDKWLKWFGTLYNCEKRKISDTASKLRNAKYFTELANNSVSPLCAAIFDRKHDPFSDDLYKDVQKLSTILTTLRSNCSASIDFELIVAPNANVLTQEKWGEYQKILSEVMRSTATFDSKVSALKDFLNSVPQVHDVLYGEDSSGAFKRLGLERKSKAFIFQGYRNIMVCLHRHHFGSAMDFKATLSQTNTSLTLTAFKKKCPCGQVVVV